MSTPNRSYQMCYVCNLYVDDKTTHDCPVAKELIENPTEVNWRGSDFIHDEFRKAWLSSSAAARVGEQNRKMDPLAPRDRSEVAAIEKATGRRYIGNNFEGVDVPREIREKYGN